MQNPTKEVIIAFNHVKKFFPTLSLVFFTIDDKWCYMNEELEYFNFDEIKSDEKIDVNILQDAMDSIETLPYIYQPQ